MEIEDAQKSDAADLANLINIAGEGLPEYIWNGMREGDESAMDVGVRRAQREEGDFSYRKAKVIKENNIVVGFVIDYLLDDPYPLDDLHEYPDVVKPLVELESLAPGSWYVNGLATKTEYRKRGIASALLERSKQNAIDLGANSWSIIVSSENTRAKNIYLKSGFEFVESRTMVSFPGVLHSGDWKLLVKPL